MKNLTTSITLLYVLIILFNTSCESDATFMVPDGHSKLYAFCEISPSEKINVSVTTAVGLNTDDDFFYPRQSDASIVLYENGVPLENPGFRYISKSKSFVSQGSFRPKEGIEYGLEIQLNDEKFSIKPIFAKTVIPLADTISEMSFSNADSHFVQGAIDLKNTNNDYFKLSFTSEQTSSLLITENLSNTSGGKIINGGKSMLINKHELENMTVELNLFNSSEAHTPSLNVELRSITKEAYDFHIAFDGQVHESTHLLYEPVMDKSNFENGLGLFTGFSSYTSTVLIK